ncbi:methylmalonyl Co-A mutase-associated GTPase MeaB [Haliangium ochraceum]|uniref:LAO/AO transport system ATPase n=1 Tax=Haliangium ochraceum (strain DSM 14365 / JCM 11303 / SMP-2) TaxID=502025 RepID=D0LYC2_HALO1|nr:methylmalonyl Co-A mutase-associated GTPase MeaB [Haliangium ochraceum]ACY16272.1 LAO/AO transport system ATPase [Haliangium ochraceum DSM 14365]
MSDIQTRIDTILQGDIRIASRLMRDIDDRMPAAFAALKQLYAHTGKGYIIGITGNPGAGKSTLVDALIGAYRAEGLRVGVVAVDPTSPFTGGAILGDRIRMQRHALDEGVFVRSLATRGHLGGLSRSTFDVVCVLDAMGYDRILIETVGVGQDEIEVMRTAHTSVVVTVPGLGDDVQALKAGLLEIADVLVVNKSDREGADRTVRDLMHMLELRRHELGVNHEVDIVKTVAAHGNREGSGVRELMDAIARHREGAAGEHGERSRVRAAAYLSELIKGLLSDRAERALRDRGGLDEIADKISTRDLDPYSAAEAIVAEM